MDLFQLNNNLKKYASSAKFRKVLLAFIKENPHLVLQYNKKQLFEDSIGADGIDLGFYSYSIVKYSDYKKGGEPYTMFESGRFYDGMFAKVYYNKIIISSSVEYLDEILDNPNFITNEFFGLTDENLILLKRIHLTPYLREWILKKLKS